MPGVRRMSRRRLMVIPTLTLTLTLTPTLALAVASLTLNLTLILTLSWKRAVRKKTPSKSSVLSIGMNQGHPPKPLP
jgi:hypothetical protein